jgi:hypothetical protein
VECVQEMPGRGMTHKEILDDHEEGALMESGAVKRGFAGGKPLSISSPAASATSFAAAARELVREAARLFAQ